MNAKREGGHTAGEWTHPYLGVQHFPQGQRYSTGSFWATVCDHETFAIAQVWTPGCGFNSIQTTHATAADARAHAEGHLFVLTRGVLGNPIERQSGADHE